MFVNRHIVNEDLKYVNKLEANTGAFGESLNNVRSKISKKTAVDAFLHFLEKNNFRIEHHMFQMPYRKMFKRGILQKELITEELSQNKIQVFDALLDYTNEMLNEDYSIFDK